MHLLDLKTLEDIKDQLNYSKLWILLLSQMMYYYYE